MLLLKRLTAAAVTLAVLLAGTGLASAGLGQPTNWEFGLQQSATPVMDNITSFHNALLYIIAAISIFVLVLLVIVMVRFNARANQSIRRVSEFSEFEARGPSLL